MDAAIIVGSALAFICIMVFIMDIFCPAKRDTGLQEGLGDQDYDMGKSDRRNNNSHLHCSPHLEDESET